MLKIENLKSKFSAIISERQVAVYFLFIFFIYIIAFGIFISHGFHPEFNLSYLVVLIPIFLIDVLKTTIESFTRGKFFRGKEDVSKISVIIPTHNGGKLIGRVVRELLWRFKPYQIIVSSNGSTDNTVEIIRKIGVKVIDISEAIGKVPAINVALPLVETPYVLIMDDDTFVGHKPLPTSLFDRGYEALAFRVLPQIDNWITKIQAYEYRKCMDINKKAQNKSGCVGNISGAIGLFSTDELRRQINLHTNEFSGEDLQRTLLIQLNRKNRGVAVVKSTIKTDVPDTFFKLCNQRIFGWYPGFYSNTFKFTQLLIDKKTPFLLRYDAFYNLILVMGLDIFRLVTFPVFFFYPWYILIYFVAYILIESVTYFNLKSSDPYWIILIYPFYGLFNLITRMTAAAVFSYRRLVVILSRYRRFDDYKKAPVFQKSLSALTINTASTAILFFFILNKNFILFDYSKIVKPVDNTIVAVSVLESNIKIITTAKNGDNLWKLSSQALDQYVSQKQIDINQYNKNRTIYNLTKLKDFQKVWVNDQITFAPSEISSSLAAK